MFKNLSLIKSVCVASIFSLAGAGLTSAPAYAGKSSIDIDGINLDYSDEKFLVALIALDGNDIQNLREQLSDALLEVEEAIAEVQEAREEVKNIPGASFFVKIAFHAASKATSSSVREAFGDVYLKLNEAEVELIAVQDEIGDAEVQETQEAISVLRSGLADLETVIDDLAAALDG